MLSCFRRKTITPVEYIDYTIDEDLTEKLKNTKKVVFGPEFNEPICNLPNTIESVNIYNKYFNYSLDNLPNGLKELVLNQRYNQPLDFLPSELQFLKFSLGSIFSHSLDNLPQQLKLLEIPYLYNQEINCLPDSIEEIRIGIKTMKNDDSIYYLESTYAVWDDVQFFNKKIKKLPNNLKRLFIFNEYPYIDELKEMLGDRLRIILGDTRINYKLVIGKNIYLIFSKFDWFKTLHTILFFINAFAIGVGNVVDAFGTDHGIVCS